MKKCELLVPAGGEKQLIAAVENGADAVYLGGKLFNARMSAGNFADEQMRRAVVFAHKRGVLVYVTMNTLIEDEEMEEALAYCAFLYEIGVDALIVQDLGLAAAVRFAMPDFSLHLSTQGSVYDVRGALAAKKLGFSRVVTARELSLTQIEEVCRRADIEVEVFVHGALCLCYSGQCQMSRFFGGRSGNRGQCAQPCRLAYQTFDEAGKKVETVPYALSPKDLCLIDRLGELAEAGVTSLKIEGRMKSPEYVAQVTAIYRKYLDLYEAHGAYTVSAEDRLALEQIFNRGGFTEGYLDEDPQMDLMSGEIPKHRGVEIGRVEKGNPRGTLVDVNLFGQLSRGDGVEIHGDTVCGNVVTYYKPLNRNLVRIGDIKEQVKTGDRIYRISDKAQLEELRKTFDHKSLEEGKFLRKMPVDAEFSADADGSLRLSLTCSLIPAVVTVNADSFALEDGKTEEGRIEKALGKMGATPFFLQNTVIKGKIDKILPVSLMNDLRRKAISALEAVIEQGRDEAPDAEALTYALSRAAALSKPYHTKEKNPRVEFYFFTWEGFASFALPQDLSCDDAELRYILPAVECLRHRHEVAARKDIIPYITNISHGAEDACVEAHFDELCGLCRDRGIYVGNLSWILAFRDAGVPVYGDYGLNIYNRYSRAVYQSLGAVDCVYSLEALDKEEKGFPLMITRHAPKGDLLLDRKKQKIRLIRREFSDQTILIPEEKTPLNRRLAKAFSAGKEIVRIYLK